MVLCRTLHGLGIDLTGTDAYRKAGIGWAVLSSGAVPSAAAQKLSVITLYISFEELGLSYVAEQGGRVRRSLEGRSLGL